MVVMCGFTSRPMTEKKEPVTVVVQYRSPANEKQESRLRLDFLCSIFFSPIEPLLVLAGQK